jgi:hypothetical protein
MTILLAEQVRWVFGVAEPGGKSIVQSVLPIDPQADDVDSRQQSRVALLRCSPTAAAVPAIVAFDK